MRSPVRWACLAVCLNFLAPGAVWAEDALMEQILERLEALEQENTQLRQKVETLEGGATAAAAALPAVAADTTPSEHQLPPVEPTEDGYGLAVTAEFLYWNVTEDVPYVIVDKNSGSTLFDGRMQEAGWDWDPGFRVGALYRPAGVDGWEFGARYTYFRGDGDDNTTVGATQDLFATRVHPATPGAISPDEQFDFAGADLKLDFDQVEIEIGRRFWISESLSTRLFGGPHLLWIDRDYDFRYCTSAGGSCAGFRKASAEDIELDAYGLRAGIDGAWHVGKGFGFYGNISGSALYGFFDWRYREADYDLNEALVQQIVDVDERFARVVPVLQVGGGLTYGRTLGERFTLSGQLGWEAQTFFNMAGRQFVDDGRTGVSNSDSTDLTLHGLVARFRLDF